MQAYLQFYGLARAPFDNGEPTRFVLATTPLKRLLGRLKTDIANGEGFLCVHGPPGIGKSAVLRGLPKVLHGLARVACVPDPQRSWSELRAGIAAGLSLPGGQLSGPVLAAARSEARLVVVIDQAERLSAEALDHLDVLLQYGDAATEQPYVQLVLLADRDAAAQRPGMPLLAWFDWHPVTHFELDRFGPRDVAVYIDKRMRRAGWKGGRLFSEPASRAVCELAGGNPREVNALCDRVLKLAFERCSPSIDRELIALACGQSTERAPVAPPGEGPGAARSTALRPSDFRERERLDALDADEAEPAADAEDEAPLELASEPDPSPGAEGLEPLAAMTDPAPLPIVRPPLARPAPPPRRRRVRRVRPALRVALWLCAALGASVGLWAVRDALPTPLAVLADEVAGLWTWHAPYLDLDLAPPPEPAHAVAEREEPSTAPQDAASAAVAPPQAGGAVEPAPRAPALPAPEPRPSAASDSLAVRGSAAPTAGLPSRPASHEPAAIERPGGLVVEPAPVAPEPAFAAEPVPAEPAPREAAPGGRPVTRSPGLRPLGSGDGARLLDRSFEVLERQRSNPR